MNKQGKDGIEYLDYTWNPISGCLHPCTYCYARKIAKRFGKEYDSENSGIVHTLYKPEYYTDKKGKRRVSPYPYGFAPTFHRYRLNEPLKVKKPSKIGVVYMGDLFGEWVPDSWIDEVLNACRQAPWHTYLFLTKNPKRYKEYLDRGIQIMPEYFWYGTTITSDAEVNSAWELLKLPKNIKRFLSIEPLQGPVDLNEYELLLKDWRKIYTIGKYLDWVIIGAQTGPGAKPPKPEWVQSIIDQCRAAGVPVFLKDNLNWPDRIQEYPKI